MCPDECSAHCLRVHCPVPATDECIRRLEERQNAAMQPSAKLLCTLDIRGLLFGRITSTEGRLRDVCASGPPVSPA